MKDALRGFVWLLLSLPSLLTAMTGSSQSINQLSESEKKDGWLLLFDWSTTHGWHTYGPTADNGYWEVRDGALHSLKAATVRWSGLADLTTDADYGDFDLKLEWKISPGGNSGVMFLVQENASKMPSSTGPEMQVLDNNGNREGQIPKHRAGDLYDLISCSEETVRPAGEWNEAEIYCKDGKLKILQNGVNVITTTLWDDSWSAIIANSGHSQFPDFGTYHNGKIDLQNSGFPVWFRNIKIKKL